MAPKRKTVEETVRTLYLDNKGIPLSEFIDSLHEATADVTYQKYLVCSYMDILSIVGERPETDEEYEKRVKRERADRERRKKLKKRKADAERAEYERLKAKYEGTSDG